VDLVCLRRLLGLASETGGSAVDDAVTVSVDAESTCRSVLFLRVTVFTSLLLVADDDTSETALLVSKTVAEAVSTSTDSVFFILVFFFVVLLVLESAKDD